MRHDKVGSVAATGSKTQASVMTMVVALLIIGFFIADPLFPTAASADALKLIHNSTNTASGKYGTWGSEYTCATCHNRKAGKNIKYVNYSIATPTGKRRVIFDRYTTTSNGITGVFGNDERTDYKDGSRNVCEVCHHRTLYHNYSASKLSNIVHAEHGPKGSSNRRDCNGCHQHSTGYKAPQVGECTSCHGIPPTSPATMVYGSNTLGLNPPADAGAHYRHRNIEQMECYTCHNNYGHGILNGNDMIEMGFRIDRKTWKGFSGISTVMTGTYTGTIGPPFTNNFAVAPGNPGTTLLREAGVNSCSIYCHGDGWAVDAGKADPYKGAISWTHGPLGGTQRSCDAAACHGTTPANPPNPVPPGAHKRHVGDLEMACTRCHDDYVSPHMINGRVAWNLSEQGSSATYKGYKRFSTATLPGVAPYGNCNNIYCHSNVQPNGGVGEPDSYKTVTWGITTVLACDGCHGGKQGDGTIISSGAHTSHIGNYAYDCATCHNGYGGDGTLMTHLDDNIQVVFNAYSGAYNQMPANAPGNGYGSCSANYCHSDAKGNKKSVGWGEAGPLACDACHKAAQTGNAVNTGKHTAHVDNVGFLGSNYGCVVCHANTVLNNFTIGDVGRHVNKYAEYSGARAGRYNSSTGACSVSYCHSDGKGGSPAVTVSWKDGSVINDCKGCHGVSAGGTFVSAAGEPNYANTGADTTFANSHDRHMGGIGLSTCVYCHNDTVSTIGLKVGTLHLNGMKNIAPGGGKTFTYLGDRTCANISCHGGPAQAKWGQKFAADCTGCHGNNAISFTPISSGKHKLHMNNPTFLGKNFACAACHALTVNPDDRSIADSAVHGNGFKNYTGTLAGSRSSYTTATGVCSASYCHTDGKGGTNKTFTSLNGWKSSATTLGCLGCHGNSSPADFTSGYGEPNYASTGAGTLRANDHKNHVDNGRLSCASCHGGTVDAGGAIFSGNSTHILNRQIDVQAGNGKSFGYEEGTKTCSNISCHGGKGSFSKIWGAPVTEDCTGCHGNNHLSFAPISSGSHKSHINNAATIGTYYNCTECHAKTINADERSFADGTKHGNGFIDYSGARAGGSASYNSVQGNCSNTYCHTDGKGKANVAFSSVNGWNSKTIYSNCIGCHGNDSAPDFASTAGEPNYASQTAGTLRANSHKVHVGAGAAGTCYYCHADVVGVAGSTVNTRHTNSYISYSTSGISGKTFNRGVGRTCSNIACHGSGTNTATWGGSLGCTGCHGGNAGAAPSDIKTGRHTSHVNNPDIGGNFACAECHAPIVADDTTLSDRTRHADGFVNYSGSMAGKNTAACNTAYCHSNGKAMPGSAVGWSTGATFVNCVGCHGTATGTGTFVSQAGEPNYANTGTAGSATSNNHQTHTNNLTLKGAASCEICHVSTVTAAGTQIKANSLHLDRSIDVYFDTAQAGSATYDKISRTCSNTACHGSPAPKWGDTASVSCKTCHANLMSSGAHAAHVGIDLWNTNFATMYNYTSSNSAGAIYRYGCANCHPAVATGNHRNGTYGDMDLSSNALGIGALRKLNKQILTAGAGYTKDGTTTFTCDLVYCHSDGRNTVNPAYRKSPNWYGGAFTGNKCAMCHDNPPLYEGQSHYVAQSSMGKESGHMIGIHYRNNSKGNNRNGFLGYSSSGSTAHGNSAVSTTISCNTCHSGIVGSTKVDTYAMAGTSSIFNCGSCHKADSRTPLQAGEITDAALHVNGAKNVAFAPIDFKTKAQLSVAANALGWTRNGDYKADNSYDYADLRVSAWDAQTKTCLTACHVNQPNITWGAQLQCVSCHVNQ
ncbi:CxxxxCH/CxxCH domain c-type cytochrome [Geotalea toluenoxydans]